MIGRRHRWPSSLFTRRITDNAGDAATEGVVGAIDRSVGRGMAGATGTVRIGPLADFHGYAAVVSTPASVGSSTTTRRSPNKALPSTSSGQVASGNATVLELLESTTGARPR